MIDFRNGDFLKLKPVNPATMVGLVAGMLIEGEQIIHAFQSVRDGIIFTNKRIMAINVQGITGQKKDITSLPYSKIQAYSVESAGALDRDSEMELWFSGLGKVKFEFIAATNVFQLSNMISHFVL